MTHTTRNRIRRSGQVAKELIPAASYIRMSGDQQEDSPKVQRGLVTPLADKHGCEIVEEYFDEGISGDATEKRHAFQRMIADAQAGKFKVILSRDIDRIGRFDSLEAGKWLGPLREAGVKLITASQGVVDLETMAGRIGLAVQTEFSNNYLYGLSEKSTNGKLAKAREGRLAPRSTYGYDRVYFDESGEEVKRVPHGQQFSKPKAWTVKLAISEDAQAVEVVRRIFSEFNAGVPRLRIVTKLNAEGILSPGGNRWCVQILTQMLENPTYAGDTQHFRRGCGKYFRVEGQQAQPVRRSESKATAKRPPSFYHENTHEPLVSRKGFRKAQDILRHAKGVHAKSGVYPLTGLLRCGHCGSPMVGCGRHGYTYYRCSGHLRQICTPKSVRRDVIEPLVFQELERHFAERADQAGELVERERRRKPAGGDDIHGQIKKLGKRIDTASRRLMAVPDAGYKAAKAALDEMCQERDRLLSERAASKGTHVLLASERAGLARNAIKNLRKVLSSHDPARVRSALQRAIGCVTLWFKDASRPGTKRSRWILTKGVIEPSKPLGSTGTIQERGSRSTQCLHLNIPGKAPVERIAVDAVQACGRGEPVSTAVVAARMGVACPTASYRLRKAVRAGLLAKASPTHWKPTEGTQGGQSWTVGQAVPEAVDALRRLCRDGQPTTLARLAEALGLSSSTAQNRLAIAQERGLVARVAYGHYLPADDADGPGLRINENASVAALASVLTKGETVTFAELRRRMNCPVSTASHRVNRCLAEDIVRRVRVGHYERI